MSQPDQHAWATTALGPLSGWSQRQSRSRADMK